MKKVISLMLAVMLCLGAATMVFASESVFVPSIGYKDGPEIEDAEMSGEDVGHCLIVSSITDAKEKSTDITQESRDLLLEVHQQLDDGSMKLPIEEDHVIRELVDVSWAETGCVGNDHGHKQWLAEEGNTVTVTFDLGVAKGTEVIVMVYVDGQWIPAEKVTNNGDGTVTVVFEEICPVAFCVEIEKADGPAQTGDMLGQELLLWVVLMALSLLGILALLVMRKKLVGAHR